MAVATYAKSGAKASAPVKLDKAVFGLQPTNHQLLKEAYLAYLANGRTNNAVAKKRGQVRGGGRKPWRQKGTGNARFGSSRNPIWRGGGAAFGPSGQENYGHKLNLAAKHAALRQALSLAAKENRIKIIEAFSAADGKSKTATALLSKIGADKGAIIVVATKDPPLVRATSNLADIKLVTAKYLNVYAVLNAEIIVLEKAGLEIVHKWLGGKT